MFGEDIDLCYQIKNLNHKIMFYPQARATHYHGMTTGLKQHSQAVSAIDAEARRRAYHAFYDTMKLFIDKNYRDQYGKATRWLLFQAIELKRWLGSRRGTV
mgnify:CR=1 FL=1